MYLSETTLVPLFPNPSGRSSQNHLWSLSNDRTPLSPRKALHTHIHTPRLSLGFTALEEFPENKEADSKTCHYHCHINLLWGQASVVHGYNPGYLGGSDWEFEASLSKLFMRPPCPGKSQQKMDRRHASRGRVPALPGAKP
jgi:hypothetical protein